MEELKSIISESKRIEDIEKSMKEITDAVKNFKITVDFSEQNKRMSDMENRIIKTIDDVLEKQEKKIHGIQVKLSEECKQVIDVIRNEILNAKDDIIGEKK